MEKSEISQNYIEDMKDKQSFVHRTIRNALIVGAEVGNIGGAIAERLRLPGVGFQHVVEVDKRHHDFAKPFGKFAVDFDVAVFANGFTHLDWFEDIPLEKINQIISDSLTASIVGAQSFVKDTINMPWQKNIVFVGSMAYRNVLNGSAVYCAAKAGLAHFAKCLAWELAPKGYNVFCVHPSNTEGTPMTEETIQGLMRYRGLSREEAEAYWGAVLPKNKWLQPEDIAETVNYQVSGKADYLSGANIDMAGGQR